MDLYDEKRFEVLRKSYGLPSIDVIKSNKNISDNIEIDKLINYVYSEVSRVFVGDFYMGEDSLKEYMKFFLVSYLHMKIYDCKNGRISLEKYYHKYYEENDIDEGMISDENKNKRIKLNINTKKTLERRWKEFNRDNHIYNQNHNFKANDMKNRKGHEVSKEQVNELEFLLENFDDPVVKKIRTNKFYKVTFKELSKYSKSARKEIKESSDIYKNIRYYKFERRTHYELFKKVINLINKYNYNIDGNEEVVTMYLVSLMRVKDIKNVYKYAELFFELNLSDYPVYFKELEHLATKVYCLLIGYSLYILESYSLEKQISCNTIMELTLLGMYNLDDYFVELEMTEKNIEIGDKLIKNLKSVVVQN